MIAKAHQASNVSPTYTNLTQPVFSSQTVNPTLTPTQIPVITSGQETTICGTAPQLIFPSPVPNYATMDSFVPYSNSPSTGRRKDQSMEKSSSPQQHQQQHRSIFDAFIVPGDHHQQAVPTSPTLTYDTCADKLPENYFQKGKLLCSLSKCNFFMGDFEPLVLKTFHNRLIIAEENLRCVLTTVFQKSFDPNLSTSAVVQVAPPIERNPNALIYIPPNVINENSKRPATSPYPTDYVAPVKAAGDVSLSGLQLVQFLIKATYRLPAGVTRDGIQLRINQLGESTSAGHVTDSCIKKLNFVVDALDRGLFDEAHQFFDQLQTSFPAEARTSWAQGIRLLLNELRRPIRIGSAGPARIGSAVGVEKLPILSRYLTFFTRTGFSAKELKLCQNSAIIDEKTGLGNSIESVREVNLQGPKLRTDL
uniref:Uncharacterized protein n=1 Tax=Elaeophora elaphi TaxID=1147741 RepID=A0A0R3S573_9BILA